ncbi:MAG: hypothetical protein J5I59_04670 [Saprospiraceae bacterium]|nr:hypothetical protein [Saprospiraceae bacterium]
MEINFKKYLMIFWMMVLFAPMIQWSLHIFKGGELKGAVENAPDVDFSIKGWFSGDYQHNKEKYLNDWFGFRNDLVRLHNQIDYSFFGTTNANSVVIGKDRYFFEKGYIDAYYGTNFIGDSLIADRVHKLSMLADTLGKLGKHIIIVEAPNKVRFYPEMIPDYLRKPMVPGNYESFSREFNAEKLKVFDCNAYFAKLRDTVSFPLFTKYGTHWSMYGAGFVMDSLQKLVAEVSLSELPLCTKTIDISDVPRYTDADITEGMNLFSRFRGGNFAYPQYHTEENFTPIPLKIVSISDSFYWSMIYLGFQNMYQGNQFWYYYTDIWPDRFLPNSQKMSVSDINLQDEINHTDIFIMMSSEVNLSNIGFSFVEQAYDLYFKK